MTLAIAVLLGCVFWATSQVNNLLELNGGCIALMGGHVRFPAAHTELVTLNLETGKTRNLGDIDHSVGLIFGAATVRRGQ